jgi:hypothetical protein
MDLPSVFAQSHEEIPNHGEKIAIIVHEQELILFCRRAHVLSRNLPGNAAIPVPGINPVRDKTPPFAPVFN